MDAREAALSVALEEGLLVFPCFAHDKAPATGLGGFYHATDDPDRIMQWRWRDRLVGVPTGGATGVIVLDIDPDNGGEDWAFSHVVWLRSTRAHMTRRGGMHFLWQAPEHDVACSQGRIARGVDVRGDGGFAIWWPAHGYARVNYDLDPQPWPEWLDDLNKPPPVPKRVKLSPSSEVHRGNLIGLLEAVAGAKEGKRNALLYWAACCMGEYLGAGLSESDAMAMLTAVAAQVGLGPVEAERTARSGLNRTRTTLTA